MNTNNESWKKDIQEKINKPLWPEKLRLIMGEIVLSVFLELAVTCYDLRSFVPLWSTRNKELNGMQWKDLQPYTFSFILALWVFFLLHSDYGYLSLAKLKACFSEAKISNGDAKTACCLHNLSAVLQTPP